MSSYFYVPNDTNFVVRSELSLKMPGIPDLPAITEFSVNDSGEIQVLVLPPIEVPLKQLKLEASVLETEPLGDDTEKVNKVTVTYRSKNVTLDVPTQKLIRIPSMVEVLSLRKLLGALVLSVLLIYVGILLGLPLTTEVIIISFVFCMLTWSVVFGLTVKKPVFKR